LLSGCNFAVDFASAGEQTLELDGCLSATGSNLLGFPEMLAIIVCPPPRHFSISRPPLFTLLFCNCEQHQQQ